MQPENQAPEQPNQPAVNPLPVAPPPIKQSEDNDLPGAFSLFKPSLEAIKVNLSTFITLLIVPIVLEIIFVIVSGRATSISSSGSSSHPGTILIFVPITIIVDLLVAPALIITQLASVDGKEISAGDAFNQGLKYLARLIGLIIVVYIVIVIGFLLLVVPGVFMIKRYLLSPLVMIKENLGIIDSMKRSAELSKMGGIWGILGVDVLLGIISLIPFIGWIIGFIGELIYSMAPAIRLSQLEELSQGGNSNTPRTNPLPPTAIV